MARSLSARERRLLTVLGVAAVPALWMLLRGDAASTPEAAQRARQERRHDLAEPPVVRLDILRRSPDDYTGVGRDLFKYAQRPPSARELARLRAEAERQRLAEEAARKAAEEAARLAAEQAALRAAQLAKDPPPPPKPQPPFIDFKYIGYLGPKDGRIAVFDDRGELFLAKTGETVREQFKVVEIKYDSVVMGYTKKEFQSDTRELPMSRK